MTKEQAVMQEKSEVDVLYERLKEVLAERDSYKKAFQSLKKKTQYGLVWEDHPEKLDNPDIVPLLHKDKKLSILAAEGFH